MILTPQSMTAIQRALEAKGVLFLADDGKQGVRLEKPLR
jgi:hypothetical protein